MTNYSCGDSSHKSVRVYLLSGLRVEVIGFHPTYPTVKVVAPGYADTVVPINFTGDLPVMIDATGPRPIPGRQGPDIPEDNCPRGIGRCPIDDEMRGRPQPFDVP